MGHTIPVKRSKWLHEKSNKTYVVIQLANVHATDKRYPVTVVYKDIDGKVWSRPFSEWYNSMTLISEPWYVRLIKFILKME